MPSTTTFTKTGLTFGGWSTSKNGTPISTINKISSDTKVYAIWKVTITFDSNGGTGYRSPIVTNVGSSYWVGTTNSYFSAPPGKTFAGWSLSPSGKTVSSITPTENTIVYATWKSYQSGSTPTPTPSPSTTKVTITVKEKTFNGAVYVSYSNIHGGTVTGGGSYNPGQSVQLKAVAKDNYRFVKWEEDGNTSPTRTVTADQSKTYTAVFESWNEAAQEIEDAGKTLGILTIAGGVAIVLFGALVLVALFRRH